jgi:translation initiation factor 1A
MVRNFGKGGKGCKKMKSSGFDISNRILLFKEHGQDYAVVTNVYGNGRYLCVCGDGRIERLCILRGSMRRRSVNRICKGDLVLVGLRDYQDKKGDIIHSYTLDEMRSLVNYNEITNDLLTVGSILLNSISNNIDSMQSDHEIIFEDI